MNQTTESPFKAFAPRDSFSILVLSPVQQPRIIGLVRSAKVKSPLIGGWRGCWFCFNSANWAIPVLAQPNPFLEIWWSARVKVVKVYKLEVQKATLSKPLLIIFLFLWSLITYTQKTLWERWPFFLQSILRGSWRLIEIKIQLKQSCNVFSVLFQAY